MKPLTRPSVSTRLARMADCVALSEIHASSFKRAWSDAEFEALLSQPGVHALLAEYQKRFGSRAPAGFVLYRLAADEAEILSVAVDPAYRRRGIGKTLIETTLRQVYRAGAQSIHLEVEDSNHAAIGLYRGAEFRESGRRAGYYAQGRETPGGALVMLRQLR